MAGVHVLERIQVADPIQGLNDKYRVVFHVATPVGSNGAGVSWKNVLLNTGLATKGSILTTGTGAGQITVAELASITAGDLAEFVSFIDIASGGSAIDSLVAVRGALTAEFSSRYAQFGREI